MSKCLPNCFLISFLLLGIFSLGVYGQTLSDVNGTASVVTLNVAGNSFELFVTPNAGSASNPYTIYLPMGTDGSGGSADNRNYSYYANRANLPLLTGEVPDSTTSLIFRFNVDVDDVDNEIYAAVGTGSSYEIVKVNTVTDNTDLSYTVGLDEICAASNLDCTSLEKSDPPNTSISTGLFFFLSNSRGTGQTIDPGSLEGLYYDLNLSNRIYTTEVQLFEILKGDEQLTLDFRGFTMVNYRGLYSINTDVGAGNCSGIVDATSTNTLGALGVSFTGLKDLLSTLTVGQVKVDGLTNDNCYRIRLVQCDLYGFCSHASQQIQNSPENIQTLLEKQACFFFTAGFGEQHYVVDFFQAWRDQVLKKFWLGRKFIKWYYGFAPQHTDYILERAWLQSLIRGLAFVLYGVIKYWWVFLFLLFMPVVQFRRKRTV